MLQAERESFEKKLYRLLPELKPRIVELEEIAKALPRDGVLIEFQRLRELDHQKPYGKQWGDARYVALVLQPKGTVQAVELGAAKPIEQAIASALAASEEPLSDAQELWDKVSKRVIEPLAKATHGKTTWFVSPDGELNRVPFAALSAPNSAKPLPEAVKLRILSTGRELIDLQKQSPLTTSEPIVVANPMFDRSASASTAPRSGSRSSVLPSNAIQRSGELDTLNWQPLPATAKEGEAVAALIGARLLEQQQASVAAVTEKSAPKMLHLATHAYFLPDQAPSQNSAGMQMPGTRGMRVAALQKESPLLRSGIVLAGANQPNANPTDDGYLTALEVAQLDWGGTDLVVISACESGRGEIRTGQGVYGLKRSIAVAGARSSLLSLWKVDDAATAAFMQSFYERLKKGEGRADALAATQKEFRNYKIPGWRHPYVWAAFQLSGDWKPVQW